MGFVQKWGTLKWQFYASLMVKSTDPMPLAWSEEEEVGPDSAATAPAPCF